MLQDAGKPDRPGLYVSRLCEYWWHTIPVLPRDPRKPDDVDFVPPTTARTPAAMRSTASRRSTYHWAARRPLLGRPTVKPLDTSIFNYHAATFPEELKKASYSAAGSLRRL